jgi:hypothetical protein
MATRRLTGPQIAMLAAAHVAITAMTWRDLQRRSADEVRGSKNFWRVASALNTIGSLAYVLIGQKRPAAE